MNSLQRIQATLNFQKADRVPVIAQVFGQAAVLAGVSLGAYLRDGELLARCQLQALNRYGYDAVFALMDTSVETEAMGSVLHYPQDRYPHVVSYALPDATGLESLRLPDPQRAGRMPELLKAAGILRREVGDEVLVVGCVLGPLTIATQLLGAETALYLAIDDPDRFALLLDFAAELAIGFGTAQLEAGVHLPVVFDPSASPAVVPPQFFREFELPRLQRVFAALKAAGSAASWLHIAGPAGPILPCYRQAGVDIANFDYCVDAAETMAALPQTCLDGNIKPLSFVEATPEAIEKEAAALLAQFAPRGGFILSSGCEIPPEAQPANVAALVAAVGRKE
jgi:uroporphyrinogen decarboxylase